MMISLVLVYFIGLIIALPIVLRTVDPEQMPMQFCVRWLLWPIVLVLLLIYFVRASWIELHSFNIQLNKKISALQQNGLH